MTQIARISFEAVNVACAQRTLQVCINGFRFSLFTPLFRHRVAEAGQGILTNMFEHVAA